MFGQIEDFIFNPMTKVKYRIEKTNFTRNRKLTFELLVLFLLNMPKRTLVLELYSFLSYLKGRINKVKDISASAFTQSRQKLSPDIFVGMNQVLLQEYYTDNQERIKLWKGHRLLAIDGSRITLPYSEELKSEYGAIKNQNKIEDIVQVRVSVLYDVLNELVLEGELSPIKTGEIALAHKHVKLVEKNDLVILDRGYPSFRLSFEILSQKADFLFRCRHGYNNLTKQFIDSGKKETMVEIALAHDQIAQHPNITKDTRIKVRLIKIFLESGETELLMTSLLNNETYPYDCFKVLYFRRWGVEIFYNRIKNVLAVENFSGLKKHAIFQDFYCALFISNVQSLIIDEAQTEFDQNPSVRKYGYKINTSISLGLMKNKILDLFINKGAQATLEELERILIKQIIPIRKGRKFKRNVGKYRTRTKPPMFKNRKRVV